MITEPFYIKTGMTANEYSELNRIHFKKSIDRQPAGLNFYEKSWGRDNKGVVEVENAKFSFSIPFVLSSAGVEDTDHTDEDIYKFSINSGISAEEFIDHDLARVEFIKIIQSLVELGWQPYIEFHASPRLSGRQSFRYAIEDGSYAPDPMYTPTLEEWMELGSGHNWVLHANDVFLDISFRRNSRFMEKEGKGVYLLTFRLLTKEARARNDFQGDEREKWKSLWVDSIKKDKIMRYQDEVKLIKQGYHINTEYLEPKFHPQDPVEPDSDMAKELLEYIQKHNQ